MGFVHYRVVLKLLSPLHIGKRKYRNLMETRDYVPGRTLWGALTARIVRDYFDGENCKYEKIGKLLIENFRFGYLWPSLDGENPYFPWEHEDFDYLFKSGYMGQPIDYTRGATEEGQLHEAEFISPKTHAGDQVYLMGDLWISDKNGFLENEEPLRIKIDEKAVTLKDVLSYLQLGGERNYGWGRTKCESLKIHRGDDAVGDIKIKSADPEVVLEFSGNSHLTAHALVAEWESRNPMPACSISGQIEPLTGYFYDKLILPPICYVPGSKVVGGIDVKIGKYGILLGK